MLPAGPAISAKCDIFDALAPPPLAIQYINITEVNTQRVLPSFRNPGSFDVTFFIRLAKKTPLCRYLLYQHSDNTLSFFSFDWLKPELQFDANITRYEVYIGLRELEQDESTDNTTQTFVVSLLL